MIVEFDGLNQILQQLGDLAIEEADENRALNKAAKVLQKKVIAEAPEDDNSVGDQFKLKDNIKVLRAKDGIVHVHTNKAYHAHIVEGGRSAGSKMALKRGKMQKVTWGFQQANPFFTRAFNASKPEMMDVIKEEVRKVTGV